MFVRNNVVQHRMLAFREYAREDFRTPPGCFYALIYAASLSTGLASLSLDAHARRAITELVIAILPLPALLFTTWLNGGAGGLRELACAVVRVPSIATCMLAAAACGSAAMIDDELDWALVLRDSVSAIGWTAAFLFHVLPRHLTAVSPLHAKALGAAWTTYVLTGFEPGKDLFRFGSRLDGRWFSVFLGFVCIAFVYRLAGARILGLNQRWALFTPAEPRRSVPVPDAVVVVRYLGLLVAVPLLLETLVFVLALVYQFEFAVIGLFPLIVVPTLLLRLALNAAAARAVRRGNRGWCRVLLLRTFGTHDAVRTASRLAPVLASFGDLVTVEDEALFHYVQRPRVLPWLNPFLRFEDDRFATFSDASWRPGVQDLLARADLVVFDVSRSSPHLQWEVAEALRTVPHERIHFIAEADTPEPQLEFDVPVLRFGTPRQLFWKLFRRVRELSVRERHRQLDEHFAFAAITGQPEHGADQR